MNAPLPPAGATLQATIPYREICKSLTNPRKTKRKGYIEELRQTIKAVGLMHPITVRPIPAHRKAEIAAGKKYETVIGECRFEACDFMTDIPAFWRDLDDKTVVMMQVIENLKREDVHPLEEAEGLLALQRDHGYTIEKIEEEIGLKRSSVHNLLALNKLHAPARKAFLAGEIENKSIAMLVARITDPKLQLDFLHEVTEDQYGGVKMTYKGALELLQDDYMLKLEEATFPTAEDGLVKGVCSCKACPKRTGNAQDLFHDIKSPDVCTDPPCYRAKVEVFSRRQAEEANKDGRKVITGQAAKDILPQYSYQNELRGGMVDLDKNVEVGGKQVPVRKLLDEADLKGVAVLVDPDKAGQTREVIATASIKEKLEAKGVKLNTLSSRLKGADEKAKQLKERNRKEDENTFRTRLLNALRTQYTTELTDGKVLDAPELALVAERMWESAQYANQQYVGELWTGEKHVSREFTKSFATRPAHELQRIMLDLTIAGEREEQYESRKAVVMLELAKHRGIKVDDIKADIIKDRREKDARQKKAAAKPKAAKPASTPPEAAQAQNEGGGKPKPKAAPAPAKKQPARPKAKANPAPAKTPAKGTKKTRPAQAAPAEKTKDQPQLDLAQPALKTITSDGEPIPSIKTALNPAAVWPFPTASRPK